jgi:hypothetical protein
VFNVTARLAAAGRRRRPLPLRTGSPRDRGDGGAGLLPPHRQVCRLADRLSDGCRRRDVLQVHTQHPSRLAIPRRPWSEGHGGSTWASPDGCASRLLGRASVLATTRARANAGVGVPAGRPLVAAVLIEAGWVAAWTRRSYLGALYGRLVRRRGPKKAVMAVAHSFLVGQSRAHATQSVCRPPSRRKSLPLQDVPLLPQDLVLPPQPPQLLALLGRQSGRARPRPPPPVRPSGVPRLTQIELATDRLERPPRFRTAHAANRSANSLGVR